MEYKDWLKLTDEQKKAVKKLYWASTWRSVKGFARAALFYFAANMAVILLDKTYVNSPDFVSLSYLVNSIFYFVSIFRINRKERDRVSEEIKKILQS